MIDNVDLMTKTINCNRFDDSNNNNDNSNNGHNNNITNNIVTIITKIITENNMATSAFYKIYSRYKSFIMIE